MNEHLSDGQIRAAVDGELDDAGQRHLNGCPRCQQRFSAGQQAVRQVAGRLAFLSSPDDPALRERTAGAALAQYRRIHAQTKETTMIQKIFASRLLRLGAAAALLLAILLSVPSTRAWAGQFLGLFRIQQVTVLPIDSTGFEKLNGNKALAEQIGQMISKSIDVRREPGQPKPVANAEEASQVVGFPVRMPQNEAATKMTVQGDAAFTFKVDRAKAQALLEEAGREDLKLPASLDGANIEVTIPASVSASFGKCPDLVNEGKADPDELGSAARLYGDCIIFAQMPSPMVNTPPDLNVQEVAEIALEFTGMSREQATQFSQSVDWTSSLVIPLPRNAATNKQVTVDGVSATLIERPSDDAPEFLLLWVKDGIIYAMSGLGNHADQAIQLANTLK